MLGRLIAKLRSRAPRPEDIAVAEALRFRNETLKTLAVARSFGVRLNEPR
jgi:hypothetical protein